MAITRAQTSTNFAAEAAEAAPIGGVARPAERQARIDAVVAVAKRHAEAVDREARFPKEACAELRAQRLLSLLLSDDCGGEAATISDVAQICYALGRVCSSTSMIFAMHSANVACIARHGDSNATFVDYLRRIGVEQLLVASSTTEGQTAPTCARARRRSSGTGIGYP